MLHAAVVTVVGLVLLGCVKVAAQRARSFACADICAGALVVIVYLAIAHLITGQHTSAICSGEDPDVLRFAATGAIALSAFTYIGLIRLWPLRKPGLGFTLNGIPVGITIGACAGCILSMAMSGVCSKVRGWPPALGEYLLYSSIIPLSVVEEAVFRGRIMQVLSARMRSSETVNVFQAALFMLAHARSIFLVSAVYGMPYGDATRQLATIFVYGYTFGLLSIRCRSL